MSNPYDEWKEQRARRCARPPVVWLYPRRPGIHGPVSRVGAWNMQVQLAYAGGLIDERQTQWVMARSARVRPVWAERWAAALDAFLA